MADRTLGVFNFLIPLGVAMSAFGSSLSIQFSNARLCYVASKEGHMLEVLSYIHVRRFTPASAVILQVSFIMRPNYWIASSTIFQNILKYRIIVQFQTINSIRKWIQILPIRSPDYSSQKLVYCEVQISTIFKFNLFQNFYILISLWLWTLRRKGNCLRLILWLHIRKIKCIDRLFLDWGTMIC